MSEQPWVRKGRTKSREVTLDASVASVLKGELEDTATRTITVTQYAPALARVFAVPGLWSNVELALGRELRVVSTVPPGGTSSDLASVLDETAVTQVFPAATARADAVLALDIEARRLNLADTCEALSRATQVGTGGPLLTEYVGERLSAFAARDANGIAPLRACMQWLETPTIAKKLQSHAIQVLVNRLLLVDASVELRALVGLTCLRLVGRQPEGHLARMLAHTLLPNLLGLQCAATIVSASAVFASAPAERRVMVEMLGDVPNPSYSALRVWIE